MRTDKGICANNCNSEYTWGTGIQLYTNGGDWFEDINGEEYNNNICHGGDYQIENVGRIVYCLKLPSGIYQAYLLRCYCMTYGEDENVLVLGRCMYGRHPFIISQTYRHYRLLNNASNLNTDICNFFKWEGQLCGRCKPGYGFPVYLLQMFFVNCIDYGKNWIKYVAASFLLLTAFFLVVLIFRISATSPSLNAFIFILTTPVLLCIVATDTRLHKNTQSCKF